MNEPIEEGLKLNVADKQISIWLVPPKNLKSSGRGMAICKLKIL